MQSRNSKLLMATILLTLLLSTSVTRAHAFTNGQSASLVIGQPNFETSTAVTSQSGLNSKDDQGGLAFDSSGNLWVGDSGRVLEFRPPFSTGMPASLVIGQKDFTTARPATTEDGLAKPNAVAFDHSGTLWVADAGNFRVLEFNPPFSDGMSASLAIGQANFETNRISISQSGLSSNSDDRAVDSSGNVWVGENRVLEFRAPFSNGMNASVVIGQANFATATASVGRTGLSGTYAVSVTADSAGNLWVADRGNNRVLEFESPFSNGMAASLVIGQQDFDSSQPATTQSGLSGPGRLAFDSSGNLWVADNGNNRVLEFTTTSSTSSTTTTSSITSSTSASSTTSSTSTSSTVPEFPTTSLAIIAIASLAVVALVLRKFPMRLVDR